MDCDIVKGKALTKNECKVLLDLIEKSKILATKTMNATNNKFKNEEWIRLAKRFNATATNRPRTPQQLRLKWENLKKNSRKRRNIRKNQNKTGGDPDDYIHPDDILDRVTNMLESTATGFTVPFGDDKETVAFVIGGVDGDGASSCDARVSAEIFNENAVLMSVSGTTESIHNENRSSRNRAIAEYFTAKKQYLYAKLSSIELEQKSFKLINKELELKCSNLLLENENCKLRIRELELKCEILEKEKLK